MLVDGEHVFEGERLEVEAVAGVVVGGDGLGIAVDHDGLVAVLAQGEGGVAAAVVELDSLPDAVGTAAEDDDLLARGRCGLVLFVVAAIEVGRVAFELGGAGVHQFEDGLDAELARGGRGPAAVPLAPSSSHSAARRSSETPMRLARRRSMAVAASGPTAAMALISSVICFIWFRNQGSIEVRRATSRTRHTLLEGVAEVGEALRMRRDQALGEAARLDVGRGGLLAGLERADGLHQRFLEGAADGHHFADGLHLRAEALVGAGEFFELPLGDLDDDVVDGGLEAGRRGLGDVVLDFVERVADGQARGDLGDGEAGGFAMASAEERLTRGFISMMVMRPLRGSTANCTLLPPVSTPISRMQAMAASRMTWYSRSVRVCAGATVMESPVWTPMGSKFSMEQMMMTLSLRSRMTSSSYSFQPRTLSSMRHSWTGERSRPRERMSVISSRL